VPQYIIKVSLDGAGN